MESGGRWELEEKDLLSCCGSTKFANQMSAISPFNTLHHAVEVARDIWFTRLMFVGGLKPSRLILRLVNLLPPRMPLRPVPSEENTLGVTPLIINCFWKVMSLGLWSKGEQSTAVETATSTALQELIEWNAWYKEKFGFVFLICASGKSSAEILAELKRRYSNRPVVELEIAAQEQMKITKLRLAKLFSAKSSIIVATDYQPASVSTKANEDRLSMISGHLTPPSDSQKSQVSKRTRPPITTHVLDMAGGHPGAGIDVQLEAWNGPEPTLQFPGSDPSGWTLVGSGKTNDDGRSNPLMSIVDAVNPGTYRISFNTGKYNPSGFFPFVSIVFRITESQKFEHFHVPLLLAPFGFSTYRGS